MFPTTYDFREYYLRPVAQSAARVLTRCITRLWPVSDMRDRCVLGLGYTLPYLSAYLPACPRVFAALPAAFGPIHWPDAPDGNKTIVVRRGALPFADESIDRILLVHELEFAEDCQGLLEEIWRVLKPDGRVLLVVANRLGFWARSDKTPFGYGRPYSLSQAHRLLTETRFTLERHTGVLLFPPLRSFSLGRFVLRVIEPLAAHLPALSGLIVIEGSKRLFSPIPLKAKTGFTRQTLPIPVLSR